MMHDGDRLGIIPRVNPHIKKNCLASPMRRLRRIVHS